LLEASVLVGKFEANMAAFNRRGVDGVYREAAQNGGE
jgi:hypothetical protein